MLGVRQLLGCASSPSADGPSGRSCGAWIYAVLIFPGQQAVDTLDLRVGVADRFGKFDHALKITNLQEDGSLRPDARQQARSTDGWHIDVSFNRVEAKVGML